MTSPPSTGSVTFVVRVRPGASRTRVGGSYGDGADAALVVAVTARAVDGAATAAVLGAVAQALGLRRSAVHVVSGATSRTKVLSVHGDPQQIHARLARLRES